MTYDYKRLCNELLSYLYQCNWPDAKRFYALVERARAALAEPEPEGPTLRQLMMLADDMEMALVSEAAEYARAVLARWGNHPRFPDSSTQPIPVSERLPGPEDCDAEGKCWWWYPPVPEQTYGYWAHEDDAVPERAVDEQPSHWLSANALPQPS